MATSLSLWMFGVLRGLLPEHTPDVGDLLSSPKAYIVGNLPYVAGWAMAVYAVAFAIAAAGGRLGLIDRLLVIVRTDGNTVGVTHFSSWWMAFNENADSSHTDTTVAFVWCVLDGGGSIGGILHTFSSDIAETQDRDLLLRPPIRYIPVAAPDGSAPQPVDSENVESVVVSAARIKYLTVSKISVPAPVVPDNTAPETPESDNNASGRSTSVPSGVVRRRR